MTEIALVILLQIASIALILFYGAKTITITKSPDVLEKVGRGKRKAPFVPYFEEDD